MASSKGVHARKMISLLMRNGSSVGECCVPIVLCGWVWLWAWSVADMVDEDGLSPLHVASSEGHTAIIVALVEEGGADINLQGGEKRDTPLMLSVSKIS